MSINWVFIWSVIKATYNLIFGSKAMSSSKAESSSVISGSKSSDPIKAKGQA